ncbi:MAG: aldo/keto reductase [Litorilinea sp.]
MRTKILGRTGLDVTIVGLGTAFTGIPVLNPNAASYEEIIANMDEDLGVQTVHAALGAGCTLIDTAALYGGGLAERIIGRALRERPELAQRCIVTTKAGRTVDGYDYSYDGIMRSVENSLQQLGLTRLEVVYIHDAMDVPMEVVMAQDGALGALRKLQDQGVVGHIGTAADFPATNTPYIETGEFDVAVLSRAWSMLNLLAADRILPAAEKHDVGLVIAMPLERGLLATGPIPGAYYFDRNYSPEVQAHVGRIKALCQDYHLPLVAVSLQWCVRHPQIAATIPGARLPEEAIENARAAQVEIPETFWTDLEPLIQHWEEGVHR